MHKFKSYWGQKEWLDTGTKPTNLPYKQ